jgi:uracil-DNA glycosylase
MLTDIPGGWLPVLEQETQKPYFQRLAHFVADERQKHQVFPPEDEVFTALKLTPYSSARVLLLGQDPYHDHNQAHGLAFSVRPGVTPPPSLKNIFKELHSDLGLPIPRSGSLVPWARQGVLLLNAVLTVCAHQPNSHKNRGWETFTDTVIQALSEKEERVVFLLWGGYAQKKKALIDPARHTILEAAHPSPLSASRGFFGCRHFSKTNAALSQAGLAPIDWSLSG